MTSTKLYDPSSTGPGLPDTGMPGSITAIAATDTADSTDVIINDALFDLFVSSTPAATSANQVELPQTNIGASPPTTCTPSSPPYPSFLSAPPTTLLGFYEMLEEIAINHMTHGTLDWQRVDEPGLERGVRLTWFTGPGFGQGKETLDWTDRMLADIDPVLPVIFNYQLRRHDMKMKSKIEGTILSTLWHHCHDTLPLPLEDGIVCHIHRIGAIYDSVGDFAYNARVTAHFTSKGWDSDPDSPWRNQPVDIATPVGQRGQMLTTTWLDTHFPGSVGRILAAKAIGLPVDAVAAYAVQDTAAAGLTGVTLPELR